MPRRLCCRPSGTRSSGQHSGPAASADARSTAAPSYPDPIPSAAAHPPHAIALQRVGTIAIARLEMSAAKDVGKEDDVGQRKSVTVRHGNAS